MSENQTTDVATAAEADGLADIARRANWVWGSVVAGVPIMLGAGLLLGQRSVFVLLVWAAVVFGLCGWHLVARCPRCHQYFNWSERHRHSFADACTHCGLELAARSRDT